MIKTIIPKDTRYVPLTQQPYCCVPTCIQMVMLKQDIPLQSAELMAYYMGAVISSEKRMLFWNMPYAFKRPPAGWGTRLSKDFTAESMLKKLGIPLQIDFNLIDNFKSSEELLKYLDGRVGQDLDTIICYDYGTLFNIGTHSGHVCVLDIVDKKKKEVRFIDPEQGAPKWRIVKVSKLYSAMKNHGPQYMAGCWEVRKTD